MKGTTFVNVSRTLHGDTMYIPKEVQEKYPEVYVLITEEKPEVVEEVVVPEVEEVVKEVEPKEVHKRKPRSK